MNETYNLLAGKTIKTTTGAAQAALLHVSVALLIAVSMLCWWQQ